ncbi:MAG TPA: peptidylprolyl isomerase, partial [Pirellulales bacterium]|nr:peptidylprolyl isomerase [Pirellulales bacterium]
MLGRLFAGMAGFARKKGVKQNRVASRRSSTRPGPQRFPWQGIECLEQRIALTADTFVTIYTTYGAFQVELFNSAAPQTVANFLHYVNTNAYNDSIFHRSVPGFVLQGGAYTSSSTAYSGTSQFTAITTNGAVPSEAGIRNTVGTLAMALSSGPNSGTDQWFINLADNPMLDDSSDGGPFTVFGKVLGDGMQIVDQMANLPTQNAGGAFANLPVDTSRGNLLAEITSVVVDGSISGQVFNDLNSDGAADNGEVGIANQTVYIDLNNNGVLDSGELTAITDSGGNYLFQGITPNTYVVRQDLAGNHGVSQTSPATGYGTATVVTNTTVAGPNFGNIRFSPITPLPVTTTSPPTSSDINTIYIEAVYHSLVGHDADAASLSYWQTQMSKGTTRDAVARGIWDSPEHRGLEIDQYYQTFLGRAADPGGKAYWLNAFSSWATEPLVVATFLMSSEFQTLHASDAEYLTALYADILNRAPDDTGLAAWQAALQNGTLSRADAATAFVNSSEAHRQIIDGFYADFLQRTGSKQRDNLVNELDGGSSTVEDAGVGILASDEYYSR